MKERVYSLAGFWCVCECLRVCGLENTSHPAQLLIQHVSGFEGVDLVCVFYLCKRYSNYSNRSFAGTCVRWTFNTISKANNKRDKGLSILQRNTLLVDWLKFSVRRLEGVSSVKSSGTFYIFFSESVKVFKLLLIWRQKVCRWNENKCGQELSQEEQADYQLLTFFFLT